MYTLTISVTTLEEHLHTLDEVLRRLEDARLRLNHTQCSFLNSSIEYLGHTIDEHGIHPTAAKVDAIKQAPAPNNMTQLRSFLGMLNYYCKFLPNLASNLTPLYSLFSKHKKWHWGQEQQSAFQLAKDALQSDALLVHYDPGKPHFVSM